MQDSAFQSRWLSLFQLEKAGWKQSLLEELASRPFCDRETALPLLVYLFDNLPKKLEQDPSPETHLLAEAFGWTCLAFWQCGSAFPSFSENYASCLHQALVQPTGKRKAAALVIAQIIASSESAQTGRCGFNHLKLSKPEVIRESERLILAGRFEDYLKANEKYAEYEDALARSEEFKTDWNQIKAAFPKHIPDSKKIYRTLIPERNWERGQGAEFNNAEQNFQAVFDLFCWKFYLWAMEGDRPHLLKASVVFTPLGTQIFIPGYLSFDPKRDLEAGKIARLHRARGIQRQGPGFSVGRKELAKLCSKAKAADKVARKRGLTGDARYDFIAQQIGLPNQTDYRKIRKLIE